LLAPEFEREFARQRAADALSPAAADDRPRAAAGVLQRLPTAFTVPVPPETPWSPRRPAPAEASVVRPDFDWAGQVAIAVGTVVHAELVERSRGGYREAAPARRRARWHAGLVTAGVPADRIERALEGVGSALAHVAASPLARHLLDPTHAEAASELALTALLDGAPVSVKIDRTFVDADGIRWIADWKTGSHEGGDRDAFLASELRRYGGQLARYATVMRLLDGRPQRVGLYYPLLDAWVDWSPVSSGEPPPDRGGRGS
jgi:ATP-dependent helicase/nuclease subunit A